MDWAMRSGAVRIDSCQRRGDVIECLGFRAFIGDGLGDAFRVEHDPGRAIRIGGGQHPGDVGECLGFRAFVGDGLSRASLLSSAGSCSCLSGLAPSTSTGITRTPRSSPAWTSNRT